MFRSGALVVDRGVEDVEYSIAEEYHGPPLTYNLPRSFPIDIKTIPTASAASPTSLTKEFNLPLLQPLIATNEKHSKQVNSGCDVVVSPTSVISFGKKRGRDGASSETTSGECSGSNSGVIQSPLHQNKVIDKSSNQLQSSKNNDATHLGTNVVGSPTSVIAFGQNCTSAETSGQSSGNNSGMIQSSTDHDDVINGSNNILQISSRNDDSLRLSHERVRVSDNVNYPRWDSIHSGVSTQFASAETSFDSIEECDDVTPTHATSPSIVSVYDNESSSTYSVENEIINVRKEPETRGRKGLCCRCLKGNKFTAKEACIVCKAVYCGNCLLRAMGSMPEGRKCLSCIGALVHESKRGNLGKSSRLLKRLLGKAAVKQIMKAERLCQVNLLLGGQVYVNGQSLSKTNLIILQSCPHPPTKLEPGNYWYDKVSGLWGKERQKPCNIISANLIIAGEIMRNASNGNTGILINSREITKTELRLIKFAGVQCAGCPHLWLDENGYYQEEGTKNAKGNLWNKIGVRLACAALSLPIPPKLAISSAKEVNNLIGGAIPNDLMQRTVRKLLLVGYDGSGTGTIFKQAKMLYNTEPFSEDERQDIKLIIQRKVYMYLGILLEGREHFEEESLAEIRRKRLLDERDVVESTGKTHLEMENANEEVSIYSLRPKLEKFSDWLLEIMVLGNLDVFFPAANREYAPLVEELWKDAAIQSTFSRRSELQMLASVATYFLERVVDISRTDYEPSNLDILHAEGLNSSNGLTYMDFSFPQVQHDSLDAVSQHDPLLRYQLIRIPTKGVGENFKWLQMFEDAGIIIFCVSLSDYDQFSDDGNGVPRNKMLASRKLFEDLITHPTSKSMNFLLVLNKFDMLEEKIEWVPLTQCSWFSDFCPITSRQSSKDRNSHNYVASVAEQAFHYIAVKFKRHFTELTDRKLNVSLVNGLGSDSVDEALRYAKEIVKWDEERENYKAPDSKFSNESSSYS